MIVSHESVTILFQWDELNAWIIMISWCLSSNFYRVWTNTVLSKKKVLTSFCGVLSTRNCGSEKTRAWLYIQTLSRPQSDCICRLQVLSRPVFITWGVRCDQSESWNSLEYILYSRVVQSIKLQYIRGRSFWSWGFRCMSVRGGPWPYNMLQSKSLKVPCNAALGWS